MDDKLKRLIKISPHDEGGYYASVPVFAGTMRWGATREEAIARVITAYDTLQPPEAISETHQDLSVPTHIDTVIADTFRIDD